MNDSFKLGKGAQSPKKINPAEPVRFILINPDATEVFVVGSFNNWNPCTTPMTDLGHGRWIRDLMLPPGRYEYQFVVDGRWMHDRTARESVVNPFGGINSVVMVARGPLTANRIEHVRNRVKPQWNSYFRILLELRERLISEQVERLREASEPLERHSMNLADSATDEFDHNMTLSDLSAKQDLIYEVDQALRRIMDGTFGRCEITGRSIPVARLRAVPWTRFSKEVEAEQEGQGNISCPRLGERGSVRPPMVTEPEVEMKN